MCCTASCFVLLFFLFLFRQSGQGFYYPEECGRPTPTYPDTRVSHVRACACVKEQSAVAAAARFGCACVPIWRDRSGIGCHRQPPGCRETSTSTSLATPKIIIARPGSGISIQTPAKANNRPTPLDESPRDHAISGKVSSPTVENNQCECVCFVRHACV